MQLHAYCQPLVDLYRCGLAAYTPGICNITLASYPGHEGGKKCFYLILGCMDKKKLLQPLYTSATFNQMRGGK